MSNPSCSKLAASDKLFPWFKNKTKKQTPKTQKVMHDISYSGLLVSVKSTGGFTLGGVGLSPDKTDQNLLPGCSLPVLWTKCSVRTRRVEWPLAFCLWAPFGQVSLVKHHSEKVLAVFGEAARALSHCPRNQSSPGSVLQLEAWPSQASCQTLLEGQGWEWWNFTCAEFWDLVSHSSAGDGVGSLVGLWAGWSRVLHCLPAPSDGQ